MGKKATKLEVQDRVDVIVKLMAEGTRSTAILENAEVKSWGLSESSIWDYINKALKYFKDNSNIDRDSELGKILTRYEVLFVKAYSEKDYRLCVTILDKRAELIGLKKLNVDVNVIDKVVKIELVPNREPDDCTD